MRIPHRRQINDWYCGPAVLQMILAGYGMLASQPTLARAAGTNERHGTSRAGMARALRSRGFRVEARHGRTLDEIAAALRSGKRVVMLYVEKAAEEAHYAIALSVTPKAVVLNDPWHGPRYAVPRAEFLKRWRGSSRKWTRWALTVDKKPKS